MSTAAATARPGRRTMLAGVIAMVVAALAIIAAVVSWQVFSGTSTEGAVVFEMPGSTSADLTAGEWALYSLEVGGSQPVADSGDISVTGPGEVAVENTYGFFADDTSIEVDGTTYVVFARLDVPADGSYEVAITDANDSPVVLGHYPTGEALIWTVFVAVLGGILLGTAGFVTLIVGVVLRIRGKRRLAA